MATSTPKPIEAAVPTTPATTLPRAAGDAVPAWFPSWAREFAELYFAGTTCVFVLHGNVHDLTRQEQATAPATAASPSSWRRSSSARGTSCCGTT